MEHAHWQVLDAIHRINLSVGRPPTFREIESLTYIPLATLQRVLDELRREGLVTWAKSRRKTIVLTKEGVELFDEHGFVPF